MDTPVRIKPPSGKRPKKYVFRGNQYCKIVLETPETSTVSGPQQLLAPGPLHGEDLPCPGKVDTCNASKSVIDLPIMIKKRKSGSRPKKRKFYGNRYCKRNVPQNLVSETSTASAVIDMPIVTKKRSGSRPKKHKFNGNQYCKRIVPQNLVSEIGTASAVIDMPILIKNRSGSRPKKHKFNGNQYCKRNMPQNLTSETSTASAVIDKPIIIKKRRSGSRPKKRKFNGNQYCKIKVSQNLVSETATDPDPAKMPRRDLTLSDRIALLKKVESHPTNTSCRRLAEITGVPKTTISRIIKHQGKLRDEWVSCTGQQASSRKRKRASKYPDVENALTQWYADMTVLNVQVTGSVLKSKLKQVAKEMGYMDFKATDSWLSRWKARHDFKFHELSGESGGVEAEHCNTTKLTDLLKKFNANDIYNAHETGLLYRATPNGSLYYSHIALSLSKKAVDRITVLCCLNMSGTDKRKLLVIGKHAKPRCFHRLSMDSLPVLYHADRNAWITSSIFKEWLMNWDLELQSQARKIILLLDNSVAHPHLNCLQNIHLEFLSFNSTSLVQPMDMGIIQNLKTLYRGKLINHILESIEENHLTLCSTAVEVSATVDFLQALQFLADSWRELSIKVIQNSFICCDVQQSDLNMSDATDNENDIVLPLQHIGNYEEFTCIDNNLQCCYESRACEDVMDEQSTAKYQRTSEDQESEEDDTCKLELVTDQDARKFIAGLRRYFMQKGNEGSPISALDDCADFIQLQLARQSWQNTFA